MFCKDLNEGAAAWLLAWLGPEPPGPMSEAVTSAVAPPDVVSTYVVLERDEALLPSYQREQARSAETYAVISFDAGHSAFASKPRELADLLLRYAEPPG